MASFRKHTPLVRKTFDKTQFLSKVSQIRKYLTKERELGTFSNLSIPHYLGRKAWKLNLRYLGKVIPSGEVSEAKKVSNFALCPKNCVKLDVFATKDAVKQISILLGN